MKVLDRYTQRWKVEPVHKIRNKGTGMKGADIHLFAMYISPLAVRIRMFVNTNGDITRIATELQIYNTEDRRLWIRNLRNMAFLKLGDKCSRCGIRDKRVLQFNHINGGGLKEHAKGGIIAQRRNKFYQDIIEGKRTDINLLCANCNQIYEYEQKRRIE